MSNYPPGVDRLPDEQKYECRGCNDRKTYEGFDVCPSCQEQGLCNNCLFCNSCDTQFDTCECGSGEIIEEGVIDCCSQCYDEESE